MWCVNVVCVCVCVCVWCVREYLRGKYHSTIDLLFDRFGFSCMTTDNFCFYLQNRLIQTSQTGGQCYSDTSPFSIPCISIKCHDTECRYAKCHIFYMLNATMLSVVMLNVVAPCIVASKAKQSTSWENKRFNVFIRQKWTFSRNSESTSHDKLFF
jgi:hypothetical protein